ncbi:MAG: signal peptidase II [Clostridia bacterium]|nr:signal peptidase II [Clostridia bacterium]
MLAFCCILAMVVTLDRAAKIWAGSLLVRAGSMVILPCLLEFRYTVNRGMALGFLSGQWLPSLILPLAAVMVWLLVGRRYKATRYKRIATALMLGGFAGNFADRLLFGHVVDMIFFPWLPWFVCNLADIAICGGVAMLAVSLLFRPQDWSDRHGKDDRKSAS